MGEGGMNATRDSEPEEARAQETLQEKANQISQTTLIRSYHRSLLKNRHPWLRYPGHLFRTPARCLFGSSAESVGEA